MMKSISPDKEEVIDFFKMLADSNHRLRCSIQKRRMKGGATNEIVRRETIRAMGHDSLAVEVYSDGSVALTGMGIGSTTVALTPKGVRKLMKALSTEGLFSKPFGGPKD